VSRIVADLFASFIADLGNVQRQPVQRSDPRSFDYLFDGDLAVTCTLSDDGRRMVTDAWVGHTRHIPAAQRELLFALVLEINGYAAEMHDAVFSLDEERRIVLSRSMPLMQLTVAHHLDALQCMLSRVRQVQRVMLALYPVIAIQEEG
jgi:hypothetical protein